MSGPRPRTPPGYRLLGIEITGGGIFELAQGKRALFIDRKGISACTIRTGLVAERPLLGIILGSSMIVLGIMLFLGMTAILGASPGRWAFQFMMGGATIGLLGANMIAHSARRGFYLELRTAEGLRKLTIGKPLTPEDLSALVSKAREEYGYDIAVEPAPGGAQGS